MNSCPVVFNNYFRNVTSPKRERGLKTGFFREREHSTGRERDETLQKSRREREEEEEQEEEEEEEEEEEQEEEEQEEEEEEEKKKKRRKRGRRGRRGSKERSVSTRTI